MFGAFPKGKRSSASSVLEDQTMAALDCFLLTLKVLLTGVFFFFLPILGYARCAPLSTPRV